MTIQVLIADDHPLMRTAMRMTLTAEPDLEVVGETADGLTAVQLAQQLRPHVAVMDIRMPILDGVAATGYLTDPEQSRPHLPEPPFVEPTVEGTLRALRDVYGFRAGG